MILLLYLSGISLGQYCLKNLVKKQGVWKKDKKGQWPYRGGVVYRRWFKSSARNGLLNSDIQIDGWILLIV